MQTIAVDDERRESDRWRYTVRVTSGGRAHDFEVALADADYTRWSGGRVPPAEVVRAAFEFLLDNEPVGSIMSSFDCGVIRRYFPSVDDELPRALAKPAKP